MPGLSPSELVARVNRDVERSLLRARNGVRYVRGTGKPKVGATPKEVVWQRDKAQLWRYAGGPVRYDPPVLIVHSLVSRSYILDLRPGNSMVEYLVGAGLDVFMLDWGVPDALDADNGFETYVDDYLPRAVAAVRAETGCAEVTMAGYCLGGVLALLYTAGHEDAPVRNLIMMATPADFDEMGAMVAALREGRLNPEDLIDETGNVPADVLYSGFFMLAPTTPIAQYATLLENLWNDEFVDGYQAMAQWSRDHVPFPGAAFRQVVDELVRANALTTGSIRLGGRRIEFGRVRGHVLNAMAERDSVVPLAAAEPLTSLVGNPDRREQLRLPGGHVTFGTGRDAFKHTMPKLTEWIAAHSDELTPNEGDADGDSSARAFRPRPARAVPATNPGG
ncbi:MAG: poly[(R)-3-hydroxyalkanoate] polymerase subunit PhaC [Chloroflexota bacterium]|nr:poly[(R)-3-hydroxyalkanoate] polymerase subunit PhaC [Chloroflexota bacterium]